MSSPRRPRRHVLSALMPTDSDLHPSRATTLSGSPGDRSARRAGPVGEAEPEVLGVVDGLVEELRDVVVVEAVDDAAALPGAGDKAEVAQQPQLVFMIVASPCAVVLATMPPLLAAIANAGRHGVLAKSAVVMERLGATTLVAFDKTGTLTHGAPELTEIQLLPGAGLDEDELLRLVGSAEHPSEHPLGAAIVRAARHRGLDLAEASEFRAQPGRGVAARVADHLVQVGSPAALLTGLERGSQSYAEWRGGQVGASQGGAFFGVAGPVVGPAATTTPRGVCLGATTPAEWFGSHALGAP